MLPDVPFRGKIDEEDLKETDVPKRRMSEGSIVKVVWIVKENGNEDKMVKRTNMTLKTMKVVVVWRRTVIMQMVKVWKKEATRWTIKMDG